MIEPIAFNMSCPTVVRFGAGRGGEIADLIPPEAKIVLVQGLGTAAAPIVKALAGRDMRVVHCGGEPSVKTVNAALDDLGETPDVVVACGGGSVLDMGKAMAVLADAGCRLSNDFADLDAGHLAQRRKVRLIALPTTAGTGAEVTGNAVIDVPDKGAKISLRGAAIYPDVAIVDPNLMANAPSHVALHAGLDALTQVIEGYTSRFATPFTDALTLTQIPLGLRALRGVVAGGSTQDWADMAWVSLASGLALSNGGLGVAHGLASVLGARFGAPHGALCGRLLLPTLRANAAAGARVAACGDMIAMEFKPTTSDPLSGLDAWITAQGLKRLGDYGMGPDDIDAVAALGAKASSSQKNAIELPLSAYAQILQAAL